MPNFLDIESEFLDKIIGLIEEEMDEESFGVSELSEKAGMSRSNLLRRVQKLTGFSVSVLMRKVRLHEAKRLLRNDTLNVSEVSFQVGFNSVSYFIRCFREEYGYPPGEEFNRAAEEAARVRAEEVERARPGFLKYLLPAAAVLLLTLAITWMVQDRETWSGELEKSIAVLPFKNNSSDSSNVYIINGLMESILSHLQKIEELHVLSRTSVEPYRESQKTIPEISNELGVNYFIEGSGQKVGDQILLSITLVSASNDDNLWSQQYNREVVDIFDLQADVAKDIAREISVLITPDEAARIERIPTDNIEAYDLYLRGLELSNLETLEGLERALIFFDEAIIKDPNFAHPYALTAICYYYLDIFKARKEHGQRIHDFAERALELDGELTPAHIAKGLYLMQAGSYEEAANQFEKALIYNPNSTQANNHLSDIYNMYLPNTEKYLRYALRGVQLEANIYDSTAATFSYLHLANALIQVGFIEEAREHIVQSLAYDSTNIFSQYVHAYILAAKDNDMQRSREMVARAFEQDKTRMDVLRELGKMSYFMEDHEAAYQYYHHFAKVRDSLNFSFFPEEDILIAYSYQQKGFDSLASHFYDRYLAFAEADQSKYRGLMLSSYYAVMGDADKAIEFLKEFSKEDHIQYWFVRFFETDPIILTISDHPEYKPTVEKIAQKFWKEHEELKLRLEEAGLLNKRPHGVELGGANR